MLAIVASMVEATLQLTPGVPASFASLSSPNPCAVMPFAEKQERKRPALTAGSATRRR